MGMDYSRYETFIYVGRGNVMTKKQADIIGWFGLTAFVFGDILIAVKYMIVGLLLCVLGNSLFTIQGFASGLSSLWAVSILLGIINIIGVVNWAGLM